MRRANGPGEYRRLWRASNIDGPKLIGNDGRSLGTVHGMHDAVKFWDVLTFLETAKVREVFLANDIFESPKHASEKNSNQEFASLQRSIDGFRFP